MECFKKFSSTEGIRFFKFAITGAMNTAVDFAAFFVLSWLGTGVYLAQTVGYSVGILNSYIVNRSWTFQTREHFWSTQFARFAVVNLGLLLLSLGVIWVLNGKLGLHKLIAKLFATGVTVVCGFIANRLWVFQNDSGA